jgi:hypothetical protein
MQGPGLDHGQCYHYDEQEHRKARLPQPAHGPPPVLSPGPAILPRTCTSAG